MSADTTTGPTPTTEQIATIDPHTDWEAACNAGVTYTHRRAHVLTVACPAPRCPARAGEHCTTPNGWSRNFHAARADLAYGRVKTPRARKHRLTDPQAERIEHAAQDGRIYAAGQRADFRGDAADRACADALVAAGLLAVVDTDVHGGRYLELTVDGWRTFHTHRLIIDRTDHTTHAPICPCRAGEGFTTTGRHSA